ncbi:MAG: NmrA family NAD(P)-binding protein [Terriglobales bacterium]
MYAITGATGNTGSVVANHLFTRGQKVRAIGRDINRLQPLVARGAEPFTADLTDATRLAEAFSGAQAVYAMIPPSMASEDYRAYQRRVGEAIATALEKSGVKFVVSLSSFGADKPDKTGPVAGLYDFEQRLNRIPGINVLHLRAGYFMENTLAQARIIPTVGAASGPLRADLKLPMIATGDIGAFAAEAISRLDFTGQQTRELLGQRDISMAEVTTIIGKAIGKPDLSYVQAGDEQLRPALIQMGMSRNMADLILEMSAALNSGHMRALEPRSAANTTPTSYETFVIEEFLPLYKQQSAAA